jgi:hypothetical protein
MVWRRLAAAVMPADEIAAVKNRRRVSDAALPRVMTAIGPPPSNQRGESCPRRLTEARRFHDGRVNHQSVIGSPRARGNACSGHCHVI